MGFFAEVGNIAGCFMPFECVRFLLYGVLFFSKKLSLWFGLVGLENLERERGLTSDRVTYSKCETVVKLFANRVCVWEMNVYCRMYKLAYY